MSRAYGKMKQTFDRGRAAGIEEGRREGAAVAFGIVGWGISLQQNAPPLVTRSYWTSELSGAAYYDCNCPDCGAFLKAREAGVHEGTDMEWCGVCRDSR